MKKVTVEVINNSKEYKWRLVSGKEKSEWSSYHEGILTHVFHGIRYYYATDYWNGVLPTEKVFTISLV